MVSGSSRTTDMNLRRALQPSLLRNLVLQTLALSILPLLALAVATIYVSDEVVLERFQAESEVLAAASAKDLEEYVQQNSKSASLIAEIKQTRDALAARDTQAIKALLLPLKSRLGLAI